MPHTWFMSNKNRMTIILVVVAFFGCQIDSKLVRHVFEIDYSTTIARPDGVATRNSLRINGQFPGPTIEAVVGDILQIDVINKIRDGQNTTLHWHGIHQRRSPFNDGPNMITQCPLRAGVTHQYKFQLEQWGTYWYHSHVNSQYSEGLWGALIIRNKKEVYRYDNEFTITLNDWYHRSAKDNEEYLISGSNGSTPYADSLLLNGRGRYPCSNSSNCLREFQRRHVFDVAEGRRYRIRVINTSSRTTFNFSIDDHQLETIEVDGMDVFSPVLADIAEIAPAQRYSFIVTTNRRNTNRFLIRAMGNLGNPRGARPGQCGECPFPEVTAVLQYRRRLFGFLNTAVRRSTEPHDYQASVPPRISNSSLILIESLLLPYDQVPAPAQVDQTFVLETRRTLNENNLQRFTFNSTSFQLPTDKPLLHKVIDNDDIPDQFPYVRLRLNSVVQLIVHNFGGVHPFHLHGHHFYVVGKFPIRLDANGNPAMFDEQIDKISLQAPLRDTVIVPDNYTLVIRFIADNPGVWLFHCHIDWHSFAGMGFAFIEAPDVVRQFRIPVEQRKLCS